MIPFTPLRTRRLAVRMQEIAIEDAITVALINPSRHEFAQSEFLRFVVAEAAKPTQRHITDPRAWTVQERNFAVGHYLATVDPDGGNFTVGEKGRYSDYLLVNSDYPSVDICTFTDEQQRMWQVRPLRGAEAEAIEATSYTNKLSAYFHWMTGAMAAQLSGPDDARPDAVADTASYQQWLIEQIALYQRLPESEYTERMDIWMRGQSKLRHFFEIGINADGIAVLPVGVGEVASQLPGARFRADACCSEIARRMGGKPARIGL